MLPIATTMLTSAEYGFYDLISTYVVILAPVLTLQLEMSVFRHLIDARLNSEKMHSVIKSSLEILIVALFVIIIVGLLLSAFVAIPYLNLIIALVVTTAINGFLLQTARGLGRNRVFAISSILSAGFSLLAAYIFVMVLNTGVSGMIAATIIANVISGVYIATTLKLPAKIKIGIAEKDIKASILKYSMPLIPNSVALWVINASDRTIIALMIDMSANGIYAVASRFPLALMGIFSVYNMSWTEAVSLHINSKDKDRDAFLSYGFNAGVKIMASAGIVLLSIMSILFNLFIDKSFHDAYQYVPVLILGSIISSAMAMYGAVYIAKKMTKQVALTSIYAAVCNIILTILLIPIAGLFGASLATLLSFSIIVAVRYFDIKKHINIKYDVKSYALLLVVYALLSGMYYVDTILTQTISIIAAIVVVLVINKKEALKIIEKVRIRRIR